MLSDAGATDGVSVKRDIKEIMASPYESREMDRLTNPGVRDESKPFVGTNFQAALTDLEGRMRNAAANLGFEEAGRLRDEIKKMKLLDLEFANDLMTGAGERGRQVGAETLAGRGGGGEAEAFRKGRL